MIAYTLTRKNVKNINLRVKPDLSVHVSAHPRVPKAEIDRFVAENEAFILKAMERLRNTPTAEPEAQRWEEGATIYLLGRPMTMHFTMGKSPDVSFAEDGISVTMPDPENDEARQKILVKWLKHFTENTFTEIFLRMYNQFAAYNLPLPTLKNTTYEVQMGQLSSGKKVITLNSLLIQRPEACILYVAAYELAHLVQANHSPKFYGVVESVMPDWKIYRKMLREPVGLPERKAE